MKRLLLLIFLSIIPSKSTITSERAKKTQAVSFLNSVEEITSKKAKSLAVPRKRLTDSKIALNMLNLETNYTVDDLHKAYEQFLKKELSWEQEQTTHEAYTLLLKELQKNESKERVATERNHALNTLQVTIPRATWMSPEDIINNIVQMIQSKYDKFSYEYQIGKLSDTEYQAIEEAYLILTMLYPVKEYKKSVQYKMLITPYPMLKTLNINPHGPWEKSDIQTIFERYKAERANNQISKEQFNPIEYAFIELDHIFDIYSQDERVKQYLSKLELPLEAEWSKIEEKLDQLPQSSAKQKMSQFLYRLYIMQQLPYQQQKQAVYHVLEPEEVNPYEILQIAPQDSIKTAQAQFDKLMQQLLLESEYEKIIYAYKQIAFSKYHQNNLLAFHDLNFYEPVTLESATKRYNELLEKTADRAKKSIIDIAFAFLKEYRFTK